METEDNELVGVKEAAAILRMSRHQVYKLIKRGRLLPVVIGHQGPGVGTMLARSEVEQMKQARKAALREKLRELGNGDA